MYKHFLCHRRTLYNASVRGKVALQHRNTARLRKRRFRGADNLGVEVSYAHQVFLHRLTRAGQNGRIKQVQPFQFFQDRVDAACLVEVFHIGRTCWRKVAKVGGAFADFVDFFQGEGNAALVGDCGQVQHTVRRTTKRHVCDDCVADCRFRHNIAGLDLLFHKLHYLHTCVLCKLNSRRVHRRNRTVATQTHTQHFGQAVHGVCGIHTRTRTAGRTYLAFEFRQLTFVDFSCFVSAHRLEHTGEGTLFAAHSACQHRAARNEDRRDIQSRRRHQKPGHVLVAVGNHDEAVKAVRHDHRLGAVRNQITGDEGILHPDVPHRNPVAYGDCREHNRRTACHRNAHLYSIADFVKVLMPRHDFVVGAYYADEGPGKLLVRQAQRMVQGTMRSIVKSVYYCFFNHNDTFVRKVLKREWKK